MGKLFEKLRIFVSLIFVPIFLLGIFSCSESAEKSSSVSFKIPSELVENIRGVSARALTNSEYIFIEVSLSGSYSETKTEQLPENAITFSEVPVDSVVYASATIYEEYPDENGESVKTKLYTGKSESITVQEGENQINLALKRVSDEPDTPIEEGSYEIKCTFNEYGLIGISKTSTKPGDEVEIEIMPLSGCTIASYTITDDAGNPI